MLNVLELFAGARCVGRKAEQLDMNVFSADWTAYDDINYVGDIGKMLPHDVPFIPDVIWASPDCTTYTISACSTHRTNSIIPKSEYAKQCDQTNQHFIALIRHYLKVNPDMVFFIENPRGMLRKQPFMLLMQELIPNCQRHTVTYCSYGDDRMKPTDIWTNSKDWKPKSICHNYKYDSDGQIIDKHCHHESARRGAKTGTQGRKNAHERSFIPEKLIEEILQSTMCEHCDGTGREFYSCCGDDIRGNDIDLCPTCYEHCDVEDGEPCYECNGKG